MASTGPVRSRLQDSIGEYEKLFDKMNQHAEVGDIASAENCLAVCLAAMPQKRRMIHNTMLKACANAGAFRRAVLVFSKMLADGVTPSPRTFGKLLTCAARSGEGRWQQRLMQVAPELSRLDGCSWGALLDQLARQGQTAEALKLIQATGMSLDQKSIGTMVTAFAKAAQPEEAQQWLHKMSPPDLEAYNSVAHGFAKRGQVEEVEKWLKRAEDLSLDLSMVSYGCLRQSLFCAAGSARAAARQRREAAAQRHDVQRGHGRLRQVWQLRPSSGDLHHHAGPADGHHGKRDIFGTGFQPSKETLAGVRSPALQHPALRGLPAGRGPATAELRGRSLCQGQRRGSLHFLAGRDEIQSVGAQCDKFYQRLEWLQRARQQVTSRRALQAFASLGCEAR